MATRSQPHKLSRGAFSCPGCALSQRHSRPSGRPQAARPVLRLRQRSFGRCEKSPTMVRELASHPRWSGSSQIPPRGLASRDHEGQGHGVGWLRARGHDLSVQRPMSPHTQPCRARLHLPEEQLGWERVTPTGRLPVPGSEAHPPWTPTSPQTTREESFQVPTSAAGRSLSPDALSRLRSRPRTSLPATGKVTRRSV